MNFFCPDNCAYLDRVSPEFDGLWADSVFEVPRMVDKRPWLAHAFTQLLQVQSTGRNEPGIGDFRVTDDTLNVAGKILGSIKYRFLPSPSLFALSGGGIHITWSSGPDAVEVSVFPGQGVGVARLVDDVPTKAKELGPAEYGQMNDFLADLVG
jgi:hypothetical protein